MRMHPAKKRKLLKAQREKKVLEGTMLVCDYCHKPKARVNLMRDPFAVEMCDTAEEREELPRHHICDDCAHRRAEEV